MAKDRGMAEDPAMAENPATIRTTRLELRPTVVADAQAILDAYAADPRVTKYMDWQPVRNVAEIAGRLAALVANPGRDKSWAVRKLDEPALCGRVYLRIVGDEGEIGYVLAVSHWNQGLMTEAVTAVLQFARERLALRRITGTCDPENRASARVFEKCGFAYTGRRIAALVRNPSQYPRDSDCYAIELMS